MEIIYGTELSASIKEELKKEVESFKRKPHLCVILLGQNPASLSYIKSKRKGCEEVGIEFSCIELPEETTQEELLKLIEEINLNPRIDGLLVQMPLPKDIDEKVVMAHIDPTKDVDGLHPLNVGRRVLNQECFVPCTPLGVMAMIHKVEPELSGKNAVVIGRSSLVGLPVGDLLLKENCTVTYCHSKTKDLASLTSRADILVVAIGKPLFVTEDMVKPGAIVIDVGINRVDGKLLGDVDFEHVKEKTKAITPVPKGVGPMTVTMLLENTVTAYKRSLAHD